MSTVHRDFKTFKIVSLGDGAVGKTSLLISFAHNQFDEKHTPTVANIIHNGQAYTLQLWDTAGQEDYDELRPLSYPDTDCFVLCFSITNPSSLMNAKTKWAQEMRNHSQAPVVLVGCKMDLRDDEYTIEKLKKEKLKPVTFEEASKVAEEIKAFRYIEISSKNHKGVEEPFRKAIDAINLKLSEKEGKGKKKLNLFGSLSETESQDVEEYFLKFNK